MSIETSSIKLSVHLVTWNGVRYLPYLFDSLRAQPYKDWELFVWDNDSQDETPLVLRGLLADFPVPHHATFHKDNIGFAGGHNRLFFHAGSSEYFLLLNQDMYLDPLCFERLVSFLDKNQKAAAVSPRLMRWDFPVVETNGIEKSLTNVVDALGLKIFRSRRVIEQYTKYHWNELSSSFSDRVLPVFGVSGALPMFRRSAIESVQFTPDQFLDETYHSYKEDVDLAYRLFSAGYHSYVLLDVVSHHDRSGAGPKGLDDRGAAKNKREQSSWVKYHSYKNHLRTLWKNMYWQNILLDFPFIIWYEIKKCIWFILFDRAVLRGFFELFSGRKDIKEKRKAIIKTRTRSWRDIRRWWK